MLFDTAVEVHTSYSLEYAPLQLSEAYLRKTLRQRTDSPRSTRRRDVTDAMIEEEEASSCPPVTLDHLLEGSSETFDDQCRLFVSSDLLLDIATEISISAPANNPGSPELRGPEDEDCSSLEGSPWIQKQEARASSTFAASSPAPATLPTACSRPGLRKRQPPVEDAKPKAKRGRPQKTGRRDNDVTFAEFTLEADDMDDLGSGSDFELLELTFDSMDPRTNERYTTCIAAVTSVEPQADTPSKRKPGQRKGGRRPRKQTSQQAADEQLRTNYIGGSKGPRVASFNGEEVLRISSALADQLAADEDVDILN